jgi:hypothetical protein
MTTSATYLLLKPLPAQCHTSDQPPMLVLPLFQQSSSRAHAVFEELTIERVAPQPGRIEYLSL